MSERLAEILEDLQHGLRRRAARRRRIRHASGAGLATVVALAAAFANPLSALQHRPVPVETASASAQIIGLEQCDRDVFGCRVASRTGP